MNVKNRSIFCKDNLDVLEGINSKSVDLIYLDPPFNKKKTFTAPIGSSAEGASFRDYFREEDVKDEWLQTIKEDHIELHNFLIGIKSISNLTYYLYNYCYLAYMAIRLIECYRILKDTGSVYFHCDPTMSHYIKILMDSIFGEKNFRNEIVWYYDNRLQRSRSNFSQLHDIIFVYRKTINVFYKEQYDPKWIPSNTQKRRLAKGYEIRKGELIVYNQSKLEADNIDLSKYNKIYWNANAEQPSLGNVWILPILNSMAKERVGYPTQKPLALLERIIKASSKEGDMVLDPFCGCATTCIASEQLNRQWIGIDVSIKAYEWVKQRLEKEVANPEDLFQYQNEIHFSTDPPQRTDADYQNGLIQKYVYIISNPKYPNEYKVGIALDCKARLNSYQTSAPDREFKLEYSLLTPHFREIEKHIHQTFENKHEWVRANKEAIIEEIKDYQLN